MRKIKITMILLIILVFPAGCWNYKEVDKMAIVAGVAIDKMNNGQYKVTAEIVKISGVRDTKTTSKIITMEGRTLFDAVRNIISLTGKKLYWSHAKVIILSKKVASEGVTKIIDWYSRDSETRPDVNLLICSGESAEEIFSNQDKADEIKSFELEEMLKNQVSLSNAPIIDILKFDIETRTQGISTIIPTIHLKNMDGKRIPQIMGTAIIKNDKLIGFLNSEETKDLLFIRNETKGGLLIETPQKEDDQVLVTLEVFKNKTQFTPVVNGKDIKINLKINTTVTIDEIEGAENYFDEKGRRKLEKITESTLKERIESLMNKVQSEYDADIFGFGAKLREDHNKEWNVVGSNWEETFKDLKVTVITKVHIKNSAMLSKPLKEGE